MRVLTGSWEDWERLPGRTALTVGVLDGVHLGHRRLVQQVTSSGLTPVVVTFDPHPAEVLAPGTHPRLITTLEERIGLLGSLGVEVVAVLDLNEVRPLPPRTFVSDILVDRLSVGRLVTGTDFQFGKDRAGDVPLLVTMGGELGFDIEVVDLITSDGIISSSRIRDLVEATAIAQANALLGHRFGMSNEVIHGDERGREIGFPTANLVPPARKLIPGDGVYAGLARVGGEVHGAAINVGVRPTFGGGPRLIEAYLLDFERDIYGESLSIEFVEHLRPELRFDTVEELLERMRVDVDTTRDILTSSVPNVI